MSQRRDTNWHAATLPHATKSVHAIKSKTLFSARLEGTGCHVCAGSNIYGILRQVTALQQLAEHAKRILLEQHTSKVRLHLSKKACVLTWSILAQSSLV